MEEGTEDRGGNHRKFCSFLRAVIEDFTDRAMFKQRQKEEIAAIVMGKESNVETISEKENLIMYVCKSLLNLKNVQKIFMELHYMYGIAFKFKIEMSSENIFMQ